MRIEISPRLAMLGFEPVGNTPQEDASWIKNEMVKWAKVVRDAHLTTQ